MATTVEQRKDMQTALQAAGLYKGPIDGIIGKGSKAALEAANDNINNGKASAELIAAYKAYNDNDAGAVKVADATAATTKTDAPAAATMTEEPAAATTTAAPVATNSIKVEKGFTVDGAAHALANKYPDKFKSAADAQAQILELNDTSLEHTGRTAADCNGKKFKVQDAHVEIGQEFKLPEGTTLTMDEVKNPSKACVPAKLPEAPKVEAPKAVKPAVVHPRKAAQTEEHRTRELNQRELKKSHGGETPIVPQVKNLTCKTIQSSYPGSNEIVIDTNGDKKADGRWLISDKGLDIAKKYNLLASGTAHTPDAWIGIANGCEPFKEREGGNGGGGKTGGGGGGGRQNSGCCGGGPNTPGGPANPGGADSKSNSNGANAGDAGNSGRAGTGANSSGPNVYAPEIREMLIKSGVERDVQTASNDVKPLSTPNLKQGISEGKTV